MVGDPDRGRPGRSATLLLFAFGLIFLAVLGIRPLFNPDEGRYADIPAEMLATHHWVLPHLNGVAYLEKPPLQYWLSAASLAIFGHNEWAARLITALAALAGVAVVIRIGRRLYDPKRALFAGLMTASMLLYVLMGQLTTLDMLLSLCLTTAVGGFILAQADREADAKANRTWMLTCWAAMAAATLTKGLIGIVLPGSILVLYTLWQRDFAAWRHLHLGKGLLLYVALVVPWFVLVEREYPGAFDFLVIREHFQRYLTKMHDRYEPAWFFLEIIAAGSLPWLPQIISAYASGFRRSAAVGQFDGNRVLWVATVFIVVFFSASDSKLAPYILPVLPLLALLGSQTGVAGDRLLIWNARLLMLLGTVALLAAASVGLHETRAMQSWRILHLRPWIILTGITLSVGGSFCYRLLARERLDAARLSIAATGFTAVLLIAGGFSSVATVYSVQPLLKQAGPIDPGATVYTVNDYDWTLPFYLGHPVIPVQYTGELQMGLSKQPERGLPNETAFKAQWRSLSDAARPAYALIRTEDYPRLRGEDLPMRELAHDFDHVLVSRW
jgi:hypothetical protein